jgi:hypothetical protein
MIKMNCLADYNFNRKALAFMIFKIKTYYKMNFLKIIKIIWRFKLMIEILFILKIKTINKIYNQVQQIGITLVFNQNNLI